MIERREQIFVSSTYVDLKEERREVIQALLEADCIPAGMELFPASDEDSWSLIKRIIDDSDYYILIIGGRYGSIHPELDISYTEMEYDYAVASKKPVMAFVHGTPDEIPQGKTDKSDEAALKLAAFASKVKSAKNVKYWTNPAELAGVVSRGLIQLRKAAPAVGWVRGDMALTPETEAEIASLKAELAEARQRAAERSITPVDETMLEDLAQGDDGYKLAFEVEHGEVFARSRNGFTWSPTWNDILAAVGPSMLREAAQKTLNQQVCDWLLRVVMERSKGKGKKASIEIGEHPVLTLDGNHMDDIIVQFNALKLIQESPHRHGVNDRNAYWTLTPRGRELLTHLRAIRRRPAPAQTAPDEQEDATPEAAKNQASDS